MLPNTPESTPDATVRQAIEALRFSAQPIEFGRAADTITAFFDQAMPDFRMKGNDQPVSVILKGLLHEIAQKHTLLIQEADKADTTQIAKFNRSVAIVRRMILNMLGCGTESMFSDN